MTDAEIIKNIRVSTGLSQKEMADRLGIGKTTISSIETGRNPIYWDLVKKIVQNLNVNPYYFHDQKQTLFLAGKSENDALKKKIANYEKMIDKMLDIKNAK